MDYNQDVATSFANSFQVDVEVRSTKIRKIHADDQGADLAIVRCKLSIGGSELVSLPFVAKVRPSGRYLAIMTTAKDGRNYQNFGVANELRAVFAAAVFDHPEIRDLAEKAEAVIAGRTSPAQKPAPASQPTLDPNQLAAVLAQLAGRKGNELPF